MRMPGRPVVPRIPAAARCRGAPGVRRSVAAIRDLRACAALAVAVGGEHRADIAMHPIPTMAAAFFKILMVVRFGDYLVNLFGVLNKL